MQKHALVLISCLVVGSAACDNNISSASMLQRLRLLAIQAEPPNPALGQTTQLLPLVYVPPGESVTYEWSWCPVPTSSDDGYRCPVDQSAVDTIAAQSGIDGIPPLSLGTSESTSFANPFPPALLAKLCAGDSAATDLFTGQANAGDSQQVYSCSIATLPFQVMLTILGSTTDTGVVSLRLPIDETTPGNSNPVINGISVSAPEPSRLLDETSVVSVPRNTKVKLLADLESSQAETYQDRQRGPNDEYIKDANGQPVLGPVQERLTLSWFTEGGGFVDESTSWSADDLDDQGHAIPFETATLNTWTTPTTADYAAASSLVIVVARDNRGGVAWTRGVATLENAP